MYRSTKQQLCYSILICMQTIEISKLETQRFDEVYCIKAPNMFTYATQWDQDQIIVLFCLLLPARKLFLINKRLNFIFCLLVPKYTG